MSVLKLLHAIRLAKKAESLPPAEIERLRERRFRKLLNHAVKHSKFYRGFYQDHGITESDLGSVEPGDLPTIDKSTVMDHFDEFVTDPKLNRSDLERFISGAPKSGAKFRRRYTVLHTSGSSGKVGLFVYGPKEWAVGKALSLRVTGVDIYFRRKKRISFIGATDGHFATVSSFHNLPRLLFNLLTLSISTSRESIQSKIDAFQPDVVTGYASGLDLLAREQIAGHISIAPAEAYCTGDPLTPQVRSRIEEAFGVNPSNVYGSTETLTIAGECSSHHSLHLFDDWFSVQVVDSSMNPATSGRAIVSNLFNFTQPLIRYQLDDALVLGDKACGCGWPFPLIENIAGRQEEFLWFENASGKSEFIHPIVLAEFFVPGLEKFQFIQKSSKNLVMKVVTKTKPLAIETSIRNRMAEILSGKQLHDQVRLDLEFVEEIPNDPKTGKFRLVIPMPSN